MSRRIPAARHRAILGLRWVGALLIGGGLAAAGVKLVALQSPAAIATPRIAAGPRPAPPKPVMVAAAPAPDDTRFIVKHILPVSGIMKQGEFYWDETGAPEGKVVVTIDLAAKVLSIFRAGYEIGTAVIIFGAEEKPTPLGIFPITQKDAHHVSNLYDAPMPYMLRLTNDGISIHASKVGNEYVTHGCVGIPTDFARKLFAAVKLGDKVIVTRGETLSLGDAITAA